MAGYNRKSPNPFVDAAVIEANDFDDEFGALDIAFGTSGHTHDGTDGNGPTIGTAGITNLAVTDAKLATNAVTTVKILDDAVTGAKIDETTTITAASFVGPLTGNVTGNLDADSATIDSLTITSGTAVTSIDTDLSSVSASDDTLASAKAIKAYVDAQVDTADQLTELTDVTVTSVADNEVLAYDTTSSKWINQTAAEAGLQPNDAGLTSIAGLTTSANQMIYTTASDTYATTSLTAAGRAILDDADASAQRTTLGLAIGTDVQAYDAGLNSIAGLTTAADKMIYTTASDTYAVTSLTSAGRAILDDADASAQRTTLGVVIGTDVQAYDAGLASIAGLTTAADKMIYTTAEDTYAVASLTSAGRALLDDADASAQRTTLGLGTIATQASTSVNIDGGAIDGVTLGTNSAVTDLRVDTLKLDSDTISSTDTTKSISIDTTTGDGSTGGYIFLKPADAGKAIVYNPSFGVLGSSYTGSSGNLKFFNSYGCDFSSTEGAGASTSVLDDYEEGTWTPVLIDNSGNTCVSAAGGGKRYTKIGRLVLVESFFIGVDPSGMTGTDAVYISGLPYSIVGQVNGSILTSNITTSSAAYAYPGGTNKVRLYESANAADITWSDVSSSSTVLLYFSLIYQTS